MTANGSPIEVLDPSECHALLRSQDVGCVAFVVEGNPAIVPVAYVVENESIVVRTGRASRLAENAAGQTVCFEAHELEPALRAGWSVVAAGRAVVVDLTQAVALETQLVPWAGSPKEVYLRIHLDQLSGRRIEPLGRHPEHVRT